MLLLELILEAFLIGLELFPNNMRLTAAMCQTNRNENHLVEGKENMSKSN